MTTFTELISRIKPGRVWTIKGGWFDDGGRPGFKGFAVIHCDGPVPGINEKVPVTDSAYVEKLMRVIAKQAAVCDAAQKALEFYKEKTFGMGIDQGPTGMSDDGFQAHTALTRIYTIAAEIEKELGDEK